MFNFLLILIKLKQHFSLSFFVASHPFLFSSACLSFPLLPSEKAVEGEKEALAANSNAPLVPTGQELEAVALGEEASADAKEGETVVFDKVLFVGGSTVKVGNPYVEGSKVTAKVEKNGKARKIVVFKYKSKNNYRRKQGHRQPFTRVIIDSIN